jgi:epsilon-lactone hydrolase
VLKCKRPLYRQRADRYAMTQHEDTTVPMARSGAPRPGVVASHSVPSRQSVWIARTMRLAMALHFGSRHRPAPDIEAIRKYSTRYTWPLRFAAALRYPRIRRCEDHALNGEWLIPARRTDSRAADNVVLYLHGGGYCFGSPVTHRAVTTELAVATGAPVFALDYRLAPEHPFPAAVEDALQAWRALTARGFAPERIALAGDSAGAGLALALLVALRDAGEPLPACAALLSPWVDLSTIWRAGHYHLTLNRSAMDAAARRYLHRARPENLLASPARAPMLGLPPVHIQTSDAELLSIDARDLADKLRAAGNAVDYVEWTAMPHAWHCFSPLLPEARAALVRAADFIGRCWRDRSA